MKYRILGKTGLRVSEIGFGCGNIGGLMIRAPFEIRTTALRRALELGINYFDTAAAYGNGQSETNLGEVLAAVKPSLILATKFSLGPEDLNDIKAAISRSLESSLRRLRRDSVDIFQLHTPVLRDNSDSPRGIPLKQVLRDGGVADALEGLRSQGLLRFIGFTGLGDTDALHRVLESGRFDLCQGYFNLLNPSAVLPAEPGFASQDFAALIGKAAQKNLGVVGIRVLAGGALGGTQSRSGYAAPSVGGALLPGGEYEMDVRRAGKLSFLLNAERKTLSQAGIRFVLDQPAVSTALVGFSDLGQIEEAAACSGMQALSHFDLARLRELWASDFAV